MKKTDFYKATMQNGVTSFVVVKRMLISPGSNSINKTAKLISQQNIEFNTYLKSLDLTLTFDILIYEALVKSLLLNNKLTSEEKFKALFLAFAHIQRSGLISTHVQPLLDCMEDLGVELSTEKENVDLFFLCLQTIHSFTVHKDIDVVMYAEEALDRLLELKDIEPNYQADSTIERLTEMFESPLSTLTGDEMYDDLGN